ncbi:MAG: redoxin domain-containing protein [Haloarculaceae archaeon]
MGLPFDVVGLPEADHVEAGEQVPDFERPLVNDEYWEDAALSDLQADAPVVLMFHPMDGDFPATYMWKQVRNREWGADARVVGLSISSPYEHERFIEEWHLAGYELFSDPANGVAERYGLVHDLDGMAGVEEARPAVYVLDEERVAQYVWVAETWPDFPDYDAIEDAIEDLS